MLRIVNIVLILLLVGLQVKLWFGDGGVGDLRQIQALSDAQLDENESLNARNETLAAEVTDLKTGTDALEERARSELGLIGPGEEFYHVVDAPLAQSIDALQ